MHQKTVLYRSDFRFMTTDGKHHHQRAGSVAIIFCGVAAAGAALVLVAAIGLLRRLPRDDKQESCPTSEETKHVAISNEEPSTLPSFPWEPAAGATKTSISTDSARHLFMSNAHHDDDDDEDDDDEISTLDDKKVASQQHQLEFLASMTFANGGLRAPSCPCCI
jgi:hypothetical protein